MIVSNIIGILAKYTMYPRPLCSFWANLSGHFERFACNHSYGYALITGVLPITLRARFVHVKLFLQFYRQIVQTTATDGGSVDFAGASHRPDSLRFLQNSAFL